MAINLKFDLMGNPEPPSIVLANRNGNKLGQLNVNVESIDVSDKFNATSEFSFTLNKYIDGEPTPLWDKVVDFKLVYCPEWDMWFEIKVELDETTETVKTVFCTQLGQAELSQIKVYNIQINNEDDPNWDTNSETYKSTILYDKDNTDISLLDRLLKDKAPHYSIADVDESIQRIPKTFSFDGISICDAFNEIAEEIGCLFVYNSNSTKGGKPSRTISVYDLQQKCNDCGHRGEFTDKCPKCGSTNIKYGYGEDTTIFVTSDELATEGIQLVTDVDSVKNCFKLEAGDDDMTATIKHCNPNGTDYLWYFSDSVKEDMSDELVVKLEEYDEDYKEYYSSHTYNLDESLVNEYNKIVDKYKGDYDIDSECLNADCKTKGAFDKVCSKCGGDNILTGRTLNYVDKSIKGYSSLMEVDYDATDLYLYLQHSRMPIVSMGETTAEEQASSLFVSFPFSTRGLPEVAVGTDDINHASLSTANNAVLSMAKVIVKSTYKVEILSSTLENQDEDDGIQEWRGTLKITNKSNEDDNVEVSVGGTGDDYDHIEVNNSVKTSLEFKLAKALDEADTDDLSVSGLFKKSIDGHIVDDNEDCECDFCKALRQYALVPLQGFYSMCEECLSLLMAQGAGDNQTNPDLYTELYQPYYIKLNAINKEIKKREDEIAIIKGKYDESDENNKILITRGLQTNIDEHRNATQVFLNLEKYLGKKLWLEFCAYRREDKYSNSNYVSDGLNNAELFDRALEFIEVAEEEIFKSAELQHSISATLNNLLSLPKFKPLLNSFKTGNWIRVQIDDKVYKLRLLEYGFGYGDSESISVEFSDVTKIKNGVTDVKEVLEQASSMATSYDSVQRQAEKGNVARSTIDQWLVDGLNAANMQIASNDSEEVLLTKNGLLARSYDDITGTYSPEQLKITHNIMAYTDDNWETVRQAIGKHEYNYFNEDTGKLDKTTGYGMNADFSVASIISGSQMIGGNIYSTNYSKTTNETGETSEIGSHIDLETGSFSLAGGRLKYDGKDTLTVVGKMEITNSGKIACWDIDEHALYKNKYPSDSSELSFYNADTMYFGEQGLSLSDQFKVEPNGIATMTNAKVSGTITASNIVGSTITGGTITAGDTLYIGSQKDEDGNIIENSYSAWIDTDGVLHTNEAHINGTITAIDGMIGGFHIQPDLTDENGTITQRCGWLYSGELQEGQDVVQIGDHKSIFLSATDMEGTMPFYSTVERKDEDGNTVYDENGEAIYDVAQSDIEMEDWRITIGSNFGVTSDGTAYMSNCEIAGGSLRMGAESDGYHTWISKDGILNANGANITGIINATEGGTIAGWYINEDRIEKRDDNDNPIVGMSSGNSSYISLVDESTTSPIRFYAGAWGEVLEPIRTQELTFTPAEVGKALTQSISLREDESSSCTIAEAECLTINKLHSGEVSSNVSFIADVPQITIDNTMYYGSVQVEMFPSWVLASHITSLSCTNTNINLTYLGNGKVMASGSSTLSGARFNGTITGAYEFDEALNVGIALNDSTMDITFVPQTTDVEYNLTIQYIVDVKNQNFRVLEDGSLYANNAKISGSVYATNGVFNGAVYATNGAFTGAVYAESGAIGGLTISEKGISSGSDALTFESDGLVIAQQLEINDYFKANKLQVGKVSGRSLSSPYLDFESAGYDSQVVTVSATVTSKIEGTTGGWFSDYNEGKVTLTINTNVNLINAKTFTITCYYRDNDNYGATYTTTTVTIPSGGNSATVSVPELVVIDMKYDYDRYGHFQYCSSISPDEYTEELPIQISAIASSASLTPINTGLTLGTIDKPWDAIYANAIYNNNSYSLDSTISTSDVNKKNTIKPIEEKYSKLFDVLNPVSFRLNDGTSGRTHIGLIAQELKNSMDICGIDSQDLAAYCSWQDADGNETCGIRYSEFIALCIHEIQKLKNRIAELENK